MWKAPVNAGAFFMTFFDMLLRLQLLFVVPVEIMMKKILLLTFILVFGITALSQNYKTALGARLGREDLGITLQQKTFERQTVEGILSANEHDFEITGLYQFHFPMLLNTFNYYFGLGGHLGISDRFTADADTYEAKYGIDGIIGVEHKFLLIPVVISLDLKPAYNINYDRPFEMDGAFSLRYILVKEKKPLLDKLKDILNLKEKK